MGGEIAWTLRLEDGTEYRMNQWTNTVHGLIVNPDFLNGKQSAIDHALEEWFALKSDWEANRKTGNFALRETSIYAPYPFGMKPSEYGIIVTDFASKKILTLQSYTSLDRLSNVGLTRGGENWSSTNARIHAFSNLGWINGYRFLLKSESAAKRLAELGGKITRQCASESHWVDLPGSVSFEEVAKLCEQIRNDVPPHPKQDTLEAERRALLDQPADTERYKCLHIIEVLLSSHAAEHNPFEFAGHVELNPETFEIEEFADNWIGYQEILSRIRDLDFNLSPEELEAWDDRIAYAKEQAEEDA